MEKILYFIFAATRGGPMRARVIEALRKTPMNANQLAAHLGVDYRTVRHHLQTLEKNNLLMAVGDKYGQVYFISQSMEEHLPYFEKIVKEAAGA